MTADKYVIHLIKCALKNEQPDEKPANLSWNEIFRLGDKHMISNMVWYSVNKLKDKPQADFWIKWTEIKNKSLVKDITQRSEFDKITAAFEKEQVRCMPVKGLFLKKLYPQSDFRTMSDIDILTDIENAQKAGNIMRSLGYACKSIGTAHHDVYFKSPVMNIEIHKQLFSDITFKNLSEYYNDVFTNAEKISGYEFVYKMMDEEFYIYVLAHFYKHYSRGGSGIRSVMDIYVLNHNIYEKLDKHSLDHKLDLLKLLNFRNQITDLSEVWFGEKEETPETAKLSGYVLNSGTYGTMSNLINSQVKARGRTGYFLYSAFLPLYLMKNNYPILNKAPFLLPLFWIWRLISALITKRNVVMLKLRAVFK